MDYSSKASGPSKYSVLSDLVSKKFVPVIIGKILEMKQDLSEKDKQSYKAKIRELEQSIKLLESRVKDL